MLPILRIVPVGGVLLAILILVLALTPPDGSRHSLAPTVVSARGPLIDREDHPEWRQFLIRAALRRADELNRLRELPDTPIRIEPVDPAVSAPDDGDEAEIAVPSQAAVQPENAPPETPPPASEQPQAAVPPAPPADNSEDTPKLFAGLPADRTSADPAPDDVTGSIDESPGATIPIDIGETSSTELPVVLPEERPPVIRTPERTKPANQSRRKRVRRVHHAKVMPKPQPPTELGFFELLFGTTKPPPATALRNAEITPPVKLLPHIRVGAY